MNQNKKSHESNGAQTEFIKCFFCLFLFLFYIIGSFKLMVE